MRRDTASGRRGDGAPDFVVAHRFAMAAALCFASSAAAGVATAGPVTSTAIDARPVDAHPHVSLQVTLAGAAVPGSEGLAYFVPEVSRALSEGLQRAGIATSGTGDASTAIAATLEERAGDRVALSAQVRGHRVDAEGTVESIDSLVEELIVRLVPLCAEPGAPAPAHAGLRAPPHVLAPGKPVLASMTGSAPSAAPPLVSTSPTVTTPPAVASPVPAPSAVVAMPSPAPTVAALPIAPSSDRKVDPEPAPAKVAPTPPKPVTSATPSAEESHETPREVAAKNVVDPYGADARVTDAVPVPLGEHGGASFVRGRVVVHTIADPVGGYAGSGSLATQALYALLQRRLRLAIVPMGVGIGSLALAADEGQRTQSRVVVMARIDSFSLFAGGDGPVVRLRLELVIAREGRLVLHRAVLAETPVVPEDPHHARAVDPVYLAVSRALDGLLGEITQAVGPAAGEAR